MYTEPNRDGHSTYTQRTFVLFFVHISGAKAPFTYLCIRVLGKSRRSSHKEQCTMTDHETDKPLLHLSPTWARWCSCSSMLQLRLTATRNVRSIAQSSSARFVGVRENCMKSDKSVNSRRRAKLERTYATSPYMHCIACAPYFSKDSTIRLRCECGKSVHLVNIVKICQDQVIYI